MQKSIGLILLVLAGLVLAALPVSAQEPSTLVPFQDEAFGIEGLVPEGWQNIGNGLYVRQSTSTDPTLLALQTVPQSPDDLWPSLLPQLGLTTIPDSVGTFESAAFTWTLYQIDYDDGTVQLTIDLGMAEQRGKTYLALLQAAPTEYETLHEAVFLPAIEALAPLTLDTSALPYIVEDVTFSSGDFTLAGTLTIPRTEGQHPAVVLMSGTGPQDRDERILNFPIFRVLADALTRNGIAVLRYDDRGVAESEGDYNATSIYDFASDGRAAIEYLQSRPDINPDQVGLLGHSEGSIYAALIGGAEDNNAAFIILMAGPGLAGEELLRVQNADIYELAGASEAEIATQIDNLEALFPLIAARDWDAFEELAYEQALATIAGYSAEELQAEGISDPEAFARQQAAAGRQGYANESFATLLEYDPAPDLSQITVPVLAIFGELDVQVNPDAHIPPMEAAFAQSANPDVTIITIEGANHLFQAAETGSVEEYAILEPNFTPEFLPTVTNWLLERVTIIE